jgi:hypothetical protein
MGIRIVVEKSKGSQRRGAEKRWGRGDGREAFWSGYVLSLFVLRVKTVASSWLEYSSILHSAKYADGGKFVVSGRGEAYDAQANRASGKSG